jgi:DNA-binding response OmpR family regulator
VPKILAVDDSVTMRRVLELTFHGLDGFDVVSFDSGDAAMAHAQANGADLVIADASMSPDGYDLCQRLKANGATGGIPVLILGSQHTPIDADKAKSVGADDTALKPYDTNTFIEKVKGVIAKRGARAPATQVATYRTAPQAAPAPTPAVAMPAAAAKKPTLELAEDDEPVITVGGASPAPAPAPAPAPVPGIIGKPAAPPVAAPPAMAAKPPVRATVGFGASPLAAAKPAVVAPAAAKPAPAPSAAAPAPAPAAAAPTAASTAVAAAAASVAPKLEGMGLTPDQVTAILSLTKEVVERVVWEVVPDLAETIIREEIQRLTK